MSIATVKQLFTYPIKGLTPQAIDRVFLEVGHGIRGDRAFALMFVDGAQSPDIVPWMSKGKFAVQNDWPGLAALDCHYDSSDDILTVRAGGARLLQAQTGTPEGRDRISAFFTGYLASLHPTPEARHPQRSPLHLVGTRTGDTRYPDREPVHISLLSEATLQDLSDASGQPADVRRFRPNVLLEGVPAWEEFNWVGQQFHLGDATVAITARIGRCPNIEVNPDTGDRDLPLLPLLQEKYGHLQTGVLAKILTPGKVAISDTLRMI
ncbi:MOSC domain-containing protein [Phormidium sp. CCY1219]|uniref:MOSC domain-containing protein n=1 Tax=Phormidium sp. CCY1219 TaxID=2886104 RepID=UPI002D1E9509|nr:MOSC N-terminal beta barrel domain-containing protein [Phormidium sp. CCY1219]MEB3830152.1 MOSC domain-containing protein [Phormidium sp. CCY1219]